MTVKECYEAMGADYDDVLSRLRKDERIQKFLLKLLNDPSYKLLCDSIAANNMPEAFRAAHTLKGVSQNLSLTPLYKSASALSDELRDGNGYGASAEQAFEAVKADYASMVECVSALAADA